MMIYSKKHIKYKKNHEIISVTCNVKINGNMIKTDHDLDTDKATMRKNVTQSWYVMKVPDE